MVEDLTLNQDFTELVLSVSASLQQEHLALLVQSS
jgi:hypothetical protein